MQIGMMTAHNPHAVFIDINPEDNPFRQFAQRHERGIVLDGPGGRYLPEILSVWEDC